MIKLPSMRIELTTLGLLDPRSNQLSYEGLEECDKTDYYNHHKSISTQHNLIHFMVLSKMPPWTVRLNRKVIIAPSSWQQVPY